MSAGGFPVTGEDVLLSASNASLDCSQHVYYDSRERVRHTFHIPVLAKMWSHEDEIHLKSTVPSSPVFGEPPCIMLFKGIILR